MEGLSAPNGANVGGAAVELRAIGEGNRSDNRSAAASGTASGEASGYDVEGVPSRGCEVEAPQEVIQGTGQEQTAEGRRSSTTAPPLAEETKKQYFCQTASSEIEKLQCQKALDNDVNESLTGFLAAGSWMT